VKVNRKGGSSKGGKKGLSQQSAGRERASAPQREEKKKGYSRKKENLLLSKSGKERGGPTSRGKRGGVLGNGRQCEEKTLKKRHPSEKEETGLKSR